MKRNRCLEASNIPHVLRPRDDASEVDDQPMGLVSCVVDSHPQFQLELFRWFATATECAGIPANRLVVHAVAPGDGEVVQFVKEMGVRVEVIEPFDQRSPHCNKIAGVQALAMHAAALSGPVALTDTDMLIMSDPTSLSTGGGKLFGKSVDLANPPLEMLTEIFRIAGVPLPSETPDKIPTLSGNLNGGLYVLDGVDLPRVSEAWARWAKWILDRPNLLGPYQFHVDQVAMCLSLAEEEMEVGLLDLAWNLPTHLEDWLPRELEAPKIVHYHRRVTTTGLVEQVGHPTVDEQIARANVTISDLMANFFPNETFWSWRYQNDPNLGSGVGSRGAALDIKREILSRVVAVIDPASVVDVGCGDGSSVEHLRLPNYVGIDVSADAIALASGRQPGGQFIVGDPTEHELAADLVLCLDVLIHQAESTAYTELTKWLVTTAQAALLIAGYDEDPGFDNHMVTFHEPLSTTLRGLDPNLELYPLRQSFGITTYLVLKPPSERHARDYGPSSLEMVAPRHPRILDLVTLRRTAWSSLSFYPDHLPRLFEYPLVLNLLRLFVPEQSRIADIGAGVNPLVPHLHRLGYRIQTIDPSPLTRVMPVDQSWNEWGFLDYASCGWAERSWNTTLDQLPAENTFDAIISVSVIEHLKAADRRELITEMRGRLAPSGILILTVDIETNTDRLWNRSGGEQVDPALDHGSVDDLHTELTDRGFRVLEFGRTSALPDSAVDIGLFVCDITNLEDSPLSPLADGSTSRSSDSLSPSALKAGFSRLTALGAKSVIRLGRWTRPRVSRWIRRA